jgi:multidrug efflux pump subunit AcrA (membrane-fusion protein)
MLDLTTVLVRVDVPESAFAFVIVGGEARVRVDALEGALTGEIKHLIRQADPQARTFPVDIELDNRKGQLAAGLFARVSFPAGPSRPALAVPKDSLLERGGVDYVAAIIPGADGASTGMLTPVTVGQDLGEWIAITSGNVSEGAKVIIRGTEAMQPFPMPVQVVDDTGTPVAGPAAKPRGSAEEGA